ncbi:hypothetical protein ACFW2Y_24380 [Streptomyces sp. NPDC058877]|uniref:hypothetical protein n=1 Tax=unclassified Streptomyces TaxID=2593676 RepID=UPI00368FC871
MAEVLDAAFGFPSMVLTTGVVTVFGFWLLVLCGFVPPDAFRSDVEALGISGVPVEAAGSVFLATGWVLDVVGSVLLDRVEPPAALSLPLSVALLGGSLFLAWHMTRFLVLRTVAHRAVHHGAESGPHSSRTAA